MMANAPDTMGAADAARRMPDLDIGVHLVVTYGAPLTAQDLIDGYRNLIGQAHAAAVRIIGATMLPDFGAGYYSASAEAIRQAANNWIRTSGAFDGVVDFDKATQDPADPLRYLPAYDSGDHLHPNADGYRVMAAAIDLTLLG